MAKIQLTIGVPSISKENIRNEFVPIFAFLSRGLAEHRLESLVKPLHQPVYLGVVRTRTNWVDV